MSNNTDSTVNIVAKQAVKVCSAWIDWQCADGWDNEEFDTLLDEMNRLCALLGVK